MNNRLWRALAIAALVVVGAAVVVMSACQAGVAHGLAESGRFAAAPLTGTP